MSIFAERKVGSVVQYNMILLGFDFSINKPACTMYHNGEYSFFVWPHKISASHMFRYMTSGVTVIDRGDDSCHDRENSVMTFSHIQRASALAELIFGTIEDRIDNEGLQDCDIYLSSEGLSFGSTGASALDLATYKGIFLNRMWKGFGSRLKGIYTYPPATIKKVAGCTSKKEHRDKNSVIHAFLKESLELNNNMFYRDMVADRFLNKNRNYIVCCDDIVDSYFATKTMITKEHLHIR